jgi:hypothetical protein
MSDVAQNEGIRKSMIKKIKATERDRLRDKAAKTEKYMLMGYERHDAELLADAEMDFEDGGKLNTK